MTKKQFLLVFLMMLTCCIVLYFLGKQKAKLEIQENTFVMIKQQPSNHIRYFEVNTLDGKYDIKQIDRDRAFYLRKLGCELVE